MLSVIEYRKCNFSAMGVRRCFLKSQPPEREIYAPPPLFTEKGRGARCGLAKPVFVLATSCREWYESLKRTPTEKLGGKSTLLDKSVFFWAEADRHYGFGRGNRDKRIGDNEQGVADVDVDFSSGDKRNLAGMAISHVGMC